jgi:outer membrane protein
MNFAKRSAIVAGGIIATVLLSLPGVVSYASAQETAPEQGQAELSLQQAYEMTLRNNSNAKLAREKLRQADLMAGKSYTYLGPEIVASYAYIRHSEALILPMLNFVESTYMIQNNPDGTSNFLPVIPVMEEIEFQPKDMQALQLTVSLPIFAPPVYPAIGMAKINYRLHREILRLTKSNLLYAVTRIYNGALTAQEFVKIQHRSVEALENHFAQAESKFRLGQITKIGVLQAELQLTQAQKKLAEAQDLYRNMIDNLIVMIGYDRAAEGELSLQQPPRPLRPEGDIDAVQHEAIGNRSELRMARMGLELSKKNKTVTWMKFVPMVGLTFNYNHIPDPSALALENSWDLTLGARWTILQGGQRFFELCERESGINEAKISLQGARDQILLSVRQAKRELDTSDLNLDVAQKMVGLAREGFDLTSKSFNEGLSTSLDVIDANNSLNAAELGFASETFNNNTRVLALLMAMGRMPDALGVKDYEEDEEPAPFEEPEEDLEEEQLENRLGGEISLPEVENGVE